MVFSAAGMSFDSLVRRVGRVAGCVPGDRHAWALLTGTLAGGKVAVYSCLVSSAARILISKMAE